MEKIDVSPIDVSRLQPTRYQTKKAILSIDIVGNVTVELIKHKSRLHEDRVVDVCRISKNGQNIDVYQPDTTRYVIKYLVVKQISNHLKKNAGVSKLKIIRRNSRPTHRTRNVSPSAHCPLAIGKNTNSPQDSFN